MAGKNKIERSVRILWDDSNGTPRDLSHDLIPGTISGGGKTLEEVDMTGVSAGIRMFLGGFAMSEISAQYHMDDTASTGAHTVTKNTVGVAGTLTLQFGSSGSAPTTGDPEWEGEYCLIEAPVSQNAGRMVISARYLPSPAAADPAWGTVS